MRDLFWKCLLGVSALTAWTATAWAGDGFEAKEIEPTPPWLSIFLSVLFVAAMCGVACKNARRTHLD